MMLKLYFKITCPYSHAVLEKLRDLNLPFEEMDVAEEKNAAALVKRGGERKVPYLVDEKTGMEMYESVLIMTYLDLHYGKTPVHKSVVGGSHTRTYSPF